MTTDHTALDSLRYLNSHCNQLLDSVIDRLRLVTHRQTHRDRNEDLQSALESIQADIRAELHATPAMQRCPAGSSTTPMAGQSRLCWTSKAGTSVTTPGSRPRAPGQSATGAWRYTSNVRSRKTSASRRQAFSSSVPQPER